MTPALAWPQDVFSAPDPNQPLILVFKTGDWTWVRGLERRGPMLQYYETSGRHIQTERFVSVPVEQVDLDAVSEVNMAFFMLGAACENGQARQLDLRLNGRTEQIFAEAARGAVFVGEGGRQLTGCFDEHERGRILRRVHERTNAMPRPPQPSPTPWPTPTWQQIEAAQAEFRARQTEASQRSQPSYGAESTTANRPKYKVDEGEARVIHEHCRAEWPEDYSMQNWCKERQESAANELRSRGGSSGGVGSRAFRTIRDRCREEWPGDFAMQNWCEERQIEGYKSFNQ